MDVITLNISDFSNSCLQFLEFVSEDIDLIISIASGGDYVLHELKKHPKLLKIKTTSVNVNSFDKIKKTKAFFSFIFKFLPYSALNKLRNYESRNIKDSIRKFDVKKMSSKLIDFNTLPDAININSILIIDDAIDSGKTMFVVKNNVTKLYPNSNIKVAVISWTIDESIVKPDYYLYKNVLVRFPWSKDYKPNSFE